MYTLQSLLWLSSSWTGFKRASFKQHSRDSVELCNGLQDDFPAHADISCCHSSGLHITCARSVTDCWGASTWAAVPSGCVYPPCSPTTVHLWAGPQAALYHLHVLLRALWKSLYSPLCICTAPQSQYQPHKALQHATKLILAHSLFPKWSAPRCLVWPHPSLLYWEEMPAATVQPSCRSCWASILQRYTICKTGEEW